MEKQESNRKVYVVTEVADTDKQQMSNTSQIPKYTHLPNPKISYDEYKLVNGYIAEHPNMTRTDWMELAIVEKMHNDGLMSDVQYAKRCNEINSRPPRGHRKGTQKKG